MDEGAVSGLEVVSLSEQTGASAPPGRPGGIDLMEDLRDEGSSGFRQVKKHKVIRHDHRNGHSKWLAVNANPGPTQFASVSGFQYHQQVSRFDLTAGSNQHLCHLGSILRLHGGFHFHRLKA